MGSARREGGFTLLEVLVAFMMLSLVLGAAYGVFGASSRAQFRAEQALLGQAMAEAVLARLGSEIPFEEGLRRIEGADAVAELRLSPAGGPAGAVRGLTLWSVELRVAPAGGDPSEARALRTLRLARSDGGLP